MLDVSTARRVTGASRCYHRPPSPRSTVVPLKSGDRIERYVIDAALGQGGMGEVYRAHDARLQRDVALKILRVDPGAGSPSSKSATHGAARMLREARAAARLDHPNVVAMYDVGQIQEPEELRGTTYIAMELVKGESLRRYVGDARVSTTERVRWITDVARGLAAAHAAGVVHRDVKPENVMIREDGRVKVLDFGIAKRAPTGPVDGSSSTEGYVVPTVTAQGVVMGTPLYMAPEQLRAESVDGRSDQFSWGVVAYELLVGRPPWSTDEGPIAAVSQILSAKPAPIPHEANVPSHVEAAVFRALSKDPAARFETMEALLTALEGPMSPLAATSSFAPVAPVEGPTASPSPSTRPRPVAETDGELSRTGRPPRRLAAAAVVVVALVAGAIGIGLRARERPRALAPDARATAAAFAGCAHGRECVEAHGGAPYVCRASDHQCVAIDSQDCKATYEPGDLVADDTVWFGAMFPAKGPQALQFGNMSLDGAELAREEVAAATAALTSTNSSKRVRRIALVACDDSEDPMRAARHLVDDVGAPAILGFRSGQELVELADGLLLPRQVVAVASLTTNPTITSVQKPSSEPRLVWRTTYNFRALAEATARLVHDVLEPRLSPNGATRIVLVHGDDVSSVAFAETFYKRLVLNGKAAIDSEDDYQEIPLKGAGVEEIAAAAERVRSARPTLVVLRADDDALAPLMQLIEEHAPPAKRPGYLIASGATGDVASFFGDSVDRRHRVFAVMTPSNSSPNARFVIRYNQSRATPVSRVTNGSSSYDAFYLLAYGLLGLGDGEPVTGSAIARDFSRLVPPGKAIEVGPTSVLDALSVLRSGGGIDLEGAATGLDFDLATGEADCDFALLCPGVRKDGRASGEDVESGAVYRAKSGRSEGVLRCP